jgi:tRNA(fMet)-specific endonuclease VapC
MTYLLDTNLLSDSVSSRPNKGVAAWLKATPLIESYISVITIGEIKQGIARLPETHPRKSQLGHWLENDVMIGFRGRVLTIDAAVMLSWGELTANLDRIGRALPLLDSLIAAQAVHYQLTLITHNEKDFRGTGLTVVNPWE